MLSWWPETQLEWAFFAATAAQGVINTTIQMYVRSPYISLRILTLVSNSYSRIILVVYFGWINHVIYEVLRSDQ